MRHDVRSIDRLDPKFALKVWGLLSMVGFTFLVSNRNAKAMLEELLERTPAGVYTNAVVIVFLALLLAQQVLMSAENPKAVRRGLGALALLHVFILSTVVQSSSTLKGLQHGVMASSFVAALSAAMVGLTYAWLTANGDPRPIWQRVIYAFSPDATPTSRPRISDYEERIRAAAAQEERNHLARELHDSIKQQVFAIHTAAATAETRLADDPQGTRDAIARVRESARDAMLEMDALLDQMRAGPLTNASLVDGVRKQAEAVRLRTGADVAVEVGPLPREHELPPAFRQTLARIAQESLNNVAKHARAAHVHVALRAHGGELVLTVTDDGAGYDPAGASAGLGLAGMQARAAEVGGGLSIESGFGRGTSIRFAVPIIGVPTAVHIGRLMLAPVAGVVILVLLSLKIGYLALVLLPLPWLEIARLSIAWRRARRLTRSLP